jgi:ATP synthase protein I
MDMKNHQKLKQEIDKQVKRMRLAEKLRGTLLAQTAYLGTLGLSLVLPIVLGAYLGRWLDGLVEGYSIRWTMSLIFLGVMVGAVNVYLLVKDKE